jgi:glutamate synthase domain-containing protein 3
MGILTDATRAYAEEQLTVSSTAIPLTLATYNKPPNGNRPATATISVADDNIRIKFTGNPTATVGFLVKAGTTVIITGEADIRAAKIIRQTTDATIEVIYSY